MIYLFSGSKTRKFRISSMTWADFSFEPILVIPLSITLILSLLISSEASNICLSWRIWTTWLFWFTCGYSLTKIGWPILKAAAANSLGMVASIAGLKHLVGGKFAWVNCGPIRSGTQSLKVTFAIKLMLMTLAIVKISWSDRVGSKFATMSAILLCSRLNTVWREVSPMFSLTLLSPAMNLPVLGSLERSSSPYVLSLPPRNSRIASLVVWFDQ